MKKLLIGIICILVIGATAYALIKVSGAKSNQPNENGNLNNTGNQVVETKKNETESNQNVTTSKEGEPNEVNNQEESKEGYEIIVSKKDITLAKGQVASFDITFTNPDELSIREYIKCKDQDDIILVSYSNLENSKITVDVEALKAGDTEISICDFNDPDMKEIVKDRVIEENNTSAGKITKEMAFEGVNNYCHSEYDWSVAEGNPSIMYVENGEETETEYQVKFRSYTGAFVYFYVNKENGETRIVEYVPALDIENNVGTIDLYDYLNKQN